MNLRLLLFLCLCLLCPALALAELPRQVELDFAVLSGYVVMPINDEYIVDLDASDNLAVGDVLTLVTPGEKVMHPVTSELLGTVYKPTGYLKVTRINSGYSYAKPLSADIVAKSGDQVRRFEQVPAQFIVDKGAGEGLASQVKMDLPQFRWLKEGDSEQPLLTFQLQADTLTIKTVGGNLLHSYKVEKDQQLATPRAQVRQPFVGQLVKPEKNLLQQAADSLMVTLKLKEENEFSPGQLGIIRQKSANLQGVWIGPNLNGNPVAISVADLDGDGLKETAVALDNQLLIGRVSEGQYAEVATVDIPVSLQILSMDAADLNQNGRPELYLTALDGYRLASFVIEYRDSGQFDIIMDKIGWYLRVVELPGQQVTLIGQAMQNDQQSFAGKPFHVRLEGDRLVKAGTVELPGLINLYSFVPFSDNQGRLYYAYLTQDDYLAVISAEGKQLWESSEYFGGTESCFDNRKGNEGDFVLPTCIGPRLFKTPGMEIVVAQNDGQRLMQRYRKYKESRVIALNWNGFALEEIWRTASQQGYLGDFLMADADNDGNTELVMAVKFKHKGVFDAARSAIVIYELN